MADRRKTAGKKQSAASGRAGTSSRSSLNGKRRSAARTGKSSGSGRAAASRKTTARQTMKTMLQPNPAMNIEIFCWILLAVSVLIFISLFGIGGKIGNVLGGIFFGLMGTDALRHGKPGQQKSICSDSFRRRSVCDGLRTSGVDAGRLAGKPQSE